MSFWSGIAGTVSRALSTIAHPTAGIKRVMARIVYNAAAALGQTVKEIQQGAAKTLLEESAGEYPSDILEIVSAKQKEDLLAGLDVTKRVPRQLYTEAELKPNRKYLVTFHVNKRYDTSGAVVDTYISGYFNEEMTPEDWYNEWWGVMRNAQYEIDYDITSHSLARVQHKLGEAY